MAGSLLSPCEARAAADQVRELTTSSGQAAVLLRRQDGENLYGTDEGAFAEICTFPLEINRTPPADIAKNIDAVASVLPGLDVQAADRVHIAESEYRVQSVVEESLFGVVTHKTLKLVELHGS